MKLTGSEVEAIEAAWEHFDAIQDGAPDSNREARVATIHAPVLRALLHRVVEEEEGYAKG